MSSTFLQRGVKCPNGCYERVMLPLDYDIKQLSKRYSLLFSLKYKKYVKRADKGLPGGFEKIFELI